MTGPAQTPYCGVMFATCKLYLQKFALTSISFSDLLLLNYIIGGFLKWSSAMADFELHSICASIYFLGF